MGSVERIEQTRILGVFEITVAVNKPLEIGELAYVDHVLTKVLDDIEFHSVRLRLDALTRPDK